MTKDKPPKPRLIRNKERSTAGRRHVPLPAGQHKVIGCRDLMTGTSGRDSGILVRLFYPAADQRKDIREQHLLWPNWLPHENYRKGYADVAQLSSPTAIKFINWLVGSAFIPCVMNAKPLRNGSKLPVAIFSHGIGGNRTICSAICLELASNGFLVCAVEHRDGTACSSFFANKVNVPLYRSNPDLALPTVDGIGPPVQTHPKAFDTIAEEDENQESPVHLRKKGNDRNSIIPTTTTEWISFETLKEGTEEYYEKRNAQIRIRVRECLMAMNLIDQLNHGEDVRNILDGLLDPWEFKDLLDTEQAVIMGHSMGAATALVVAAELNSKFQAVVCLDAWMYPIQDETLNLSQPVIFINSEKFQSKANLRKINELIISQTDKDTTERKVVTIRGSVHYNQTDIPFVLTHLAKLLFGGSSKRNPFTAHDLTCSTILTFLRDHLALTQKLPERDHFLKKNHRKLKHGFPKKL